MTWLHRQQSNHALVVQISEYVAAGKHNEELRLILVVEEGAAKVTERTFFVKTEVNEYGIDVLC